MHRRTLLAAAGLLVLAPAARAMQRVDGFLFGSPLQLLLPPRTAPRTIDAVLAGLASLHRRWNAWKPGELGAVNAALREGRAISVAPALAATLRRAAALEAASGGLFNPAIGGLVQAWGFHADRLQDGPAADAPRLAQTLAARPSLQQLQWRGDALRSASRALQIDLGGIGKGVALDWALQRLAQDGVHDALLNLGGNLALRGDAGGRPWQIGIRDPHRSGAVAARLAAAGHEAVVTSGRSERWRIAGGARVSHLIDPRSGAPAGGLASVTVVHADAALADAAATALLVAGAAGWRSVAQRMGVAQVLAIDDAGRLDPTEALAPRLLPA